MSEQPGDQGAVILVMGMTGAGKTTFINKASGSDLRVGRSLESCTSEVQTAKPFELDGQVVTLVDSPGFDDTNRSEAEILREVTSFLARMYEGGCLLSGIVYLHRITDTRVGGVARRNFTVFRKLCGESSLKNTTVVTNMWTLNPTADVVELEAEREQELASSDKFFKRALENGAQMARHDNTTQSSHAIIRRFLRHRVLEPLQVQRELVDEKKSLVQTEAGDLLKKYFDETTKAQRVEVDELKARQRDEVEELKAGHARLEGMMRRQAEDHRKETEVLRETIRQLTSNLTETTEALQEVAKKLARVSQQTEHLHESSGGSLDRRINDLVKQAYADVRDFKRRQQRRNTTPRFTTDSPRVFVTSVPVHRIPASQPEVRPEKVEEIPSPRSSRAGTATTVEPPKDDSWSCVVQ